MWIIKRKNGTFYKGISDSIDEYPVIYTPDPKAAKPFSEEEKDAAILFSDEAWEEATPEQARS
jgi:hypothetical protein